MGVIAPERRPGKAYFGCGGAACLGLIFWALLFCCLAATVVGLSTEVNNGNTELLSTYYAFSQLMVGSLAFSFSMITILVVFIGYGLFRSRRQYDTRSDPHDLNTVTLYFFLFAAGMILSAGLPVVGFEYPGTNGWVVAGGILSGFAYLFYGALMLWLTLAAYESYRQAEDRGL